MSKKQLILVSIVAAVPGALLLVFLVLGLLQGMLSDTATVSVTLWIVWVLAALGSASAAFLPFAIMFFPGLMPEPVAAGAGSQASGIAATPQRKTAPADDSEDEIEDGEEEFQDDTDFAEDEADDEGEQLFDDDALEDDFDDDFDDNFDKKK
jgi:hypothetical protein